MTTKNPPDSPIIFFGTDAFSLPSLIRLIAEGWNIVAVVTKPDSPTGRGRVLSSPAVKRLAEANSVQVFQPTNLSELEPKIKKLGAEIGIVVAYGKIIPASMLKLFPKGLLNVHASILPRYRGASPIEACILAGDDQTGVTLMKLEAGLDTGPTYDVAKIQLDGTETREGLYERLSELGADLLAIQLPAILSDQVVPLPQNNAEATIVKRISKSDGYIDWAKPATILEREIRAYQGWPSSRTHIAGIELTITAAHTGTASGPAGTPYKTESGELAVYASTGSLVVDMLKPDGKREMTASDFLAGHPLD
jgi:methionyl-tRNA formyltransferase